MGTERVDIQNPINFFDYIIEEKYTHDYFSRENIFKCNLYLLTSNNMQQ